MRLIEMNRLVLLKNAYLLGIRSYRQKTVFWWVEGLRFRHCSRLNESIEVGNLTATIDAELQKTFLDRKYRAKLKLFIEKGPALCGPPACYWSRILAKNQLSTHFHQNRI